MFPYYYQFDDCQQEIEETVMELSHMITWPGGLHIQNGIAKGFFHALEKFETIHKYLDAITQCMKHRWTKDRYFATCLTGSRLPLRALFDKWKATIVGWRFDSVCECIYSCRKVEHVLKTTWNFARLAAAVLTMEQPYDEDVFQESRNSAAAAERGIEEEDPGTGPNRDGPGLKLIRTADSMLFSKQEGSEGI